MIKIFLQILGPLISVLLGIPNVDYAESAWSLSPTIERKCP